MRLRESQLSLTATEASQGNGTAETATTLTDRVNIIICVPLRACVPSNLFSNKSFATG